MPSNPGRAADLYYPPMGLQPKSHWCLRARPVTPRLKVFVELQNVQCIHTIIIHSLSRQQLMLFYSISLGLNLSGIYSVTPYKILYTNS